ncbi:hypothetical protein ACFFSW_25555 [Saccharothrix longispora]|uniref:Helix-turn-helix protein n=1 Tax=Saccharothrix longispora TaxID=33920 RepID=A0ABU1PPD6_9PSEU|nr:hypothetical protein [Saccharothrix longispora]MDR6592519.1 hypothetical protein [Saccharothrix longispora]
MNDRDAPARRPNEEYTLQVRGVLDVVTPREFLDLLNAMRRTKELSYTQIGKRAGKGMSRSTAQAMLTSDELPSLTHLRLFLKACRVTQEETQLWINSLHRVNHLHRSITSNDSGVATANPLSDANAPSSRPSMPTYSEARTAVPPGTTTTVEATPARRAETGVPAVPEPGGVQVAAARQGFAGVADALRFGFLVRALLALGVLVGMLTGSAIAMQHYGVSHEIMLAVYCIISLTVSSWAGIAWHYRPDIRSSEVISHEETSEIFGVHPKAAKPIIGE